MAKWHVEERLPWGTLGFVVALAFGVFALYTTFFYEKRAHVVYEIESKTRVFDVRENIAQLDVTFEGESIRKKQQTLSLLTIKIVNAGNLDIGMGAFDSANLPGISVTHCIKIFNPEFVRGSNPYFAKGDRVRLKDEHSFEVLPVLLDKHEYFVVKILVLHGQNEVPDVEKFGKYGGVPQIDIVATSSNEDRRSLLVRTFGGDAVIQFVRAVIYTILTIAVIVAGIWVTVKINAGWRRWRRRRLVQKFQKLLDRVSSGPENAIFLSYVRGDAGLSPELFLLRLNDLLNDPAELEQKMRQMPSQQASERFVDADVAWIVPFIKEQKLAELQENEGVTVNAQAAKTVADFVNFLSANEPERMKRSKSPFGFNIDPMEAENPIGVSGAPENQEVDFTHHG
jgi:hypothetical protein